MISTPAQYIPTGEWTSRDDGETFEVGRRLGLQLRGGEILLLDGPLGAGKTIFVKGLAAGLDVDADEVTSPSFTLVNPYRGRLPFFHIDLYRLDAGAAAAHAVDLDELLGNESAVIVIEWAARLGKYPLPPCVWHIKIQGDGDAARNILISHGAQQKD
ncbi:MAG: tRNA (adenosine(37)-N6)-threonylcarbamoyltransferase complex ATPase subunit type 1 TsaE [Pyrinomonadaceae bacterium]